MTNKPMLSVDRELLIALAEPASPKERVSIKRHERMFRLRALLDKQSCGACDGCANGCKLDRESPQVEPAVAHQGEPVTIQAVAVTRDDDDEGLRLEWLLEGGIAEMEFAGMMLFALPEANDLCDEDGSAEIYLSPQQEKHNAPVSVVLPFAEKIISKLRRFDECASDNQDVDIGRHWFDLLTQLGLLNRMQRSPALWEMTQQGEDALEATRINTPQ